MAETFGHKWTSNYGHEPNQSWMDGLADMTADDIKHGLGNLRSWKDEGGWPPTLLQFRELCRPHASPAHAVYKPLPAPTSSWDQRRTVAAQALIQLREGCLQPALETRQSVFSQEDREAMERLDMQRILAAGCGDFQTLDALPIPEPIAQSPKTTGCSCRMEKTESVTESGAVVTLWGRVGPGCDYCQQWSAMMAGRGISADRVSHGRRGPYKSRRKTA